jgi:hypothetical protein
MRTGENVRDRPRWLGPWRLMGPWWVREYDQPWVRWHPCIYMDGRVEMIPMEHPVPGPPPTKKLYVKELADA